MKKGGRRGGRNEGGWEATSQQGRFWEQISLDIDIDFFRYRYSFFRYDSIMGRTDSSLLIYTLILY